MYYVVLLLQYRLFAVDRCNRRGLSVVADTYSNVRPSSNDCIITEEIAGGEPIHQNNVHHHHRLLYYRVKFTRNS
jgi:hypothetical protein